MENTVLEPSKHKPYINGANAAELAKRSHEARRLAKSIAENPELHPEQVEAPKLDDFTLRRLLRVREQLDIVDREVKRCLLSTESDDLERVKPLVESSSRLSEQERFLANRPGPGTRKPKPERSARGSGSTFEPVEE